MNNNLICYNTVRVIFMYMYNICLSDYALRFLFEKKNVRPWHDRAQNKLFWTQSCPEFSV